MIFAALLENNKTKSVKGLRYFTQGTSKFIIWKQVIVK
jgi:hypothetical protein